MRYIGSLFLIFFAYIAIKDGIGISNKYILFSILAILVIFSTTSWWAQRRSTQIRKNKDFKNAAALGDIDKKTPNDSEMLDGYAALPLTEEGYNSEFALFLRPFKLDDIKAFRNPRKDGLFATFVPFYGITQPDLVNLDESISCLLDGEMELVAIGDQGNALGATRFETSEQEWKDSFLALAENAKVILVFVSQKSGTAWEISQICGRTNLVEKTVFLFPPAGYDQIDENSSLESLKALLQEFNLQVPADILNGEGLVFDCDHEVTCRRKIISPGFFEHVVSKNGIKECIRQAGINSIQSLCRTDGDMNQDL